MYSTPIFEKEFWFFNSRVIIIHLNPLLLMKLYYKNFKTSMRRNQNSHLKNYLLNTALIKYYSAVITYDS